LGGIIIRTKRLNTASSETGKEHKHVSELEMDGIHADIEIDNDKMTLEEVQVFLEKLLKSENE